MPFPTALIESYPNIDLVNYHDTHGEWIPFLSPMLDIPKPEWSDALKDAARAEAQRTGQNPIKSTFGSDLFLTDCEKLSPEQYFLPPSPQVVPPVENISHPEAITFLEPLNYNPEGSPDRALVYKVSLTLPNDGGEKLYILKIFRDTLSDPASMSKQERFVFFNSKGHDTSHGYSRIGFEREIAAYARLAYHGVTETEIVPRCYGWFVLNPTVCSLPEEVLQRAAKDPHPPRAVVLEFLPEMRRISSHDANIRTAKKALQAIQKIHSAFIQHGDIHPRNVLIRPSGEIVIVDFDGALITRDVLRSQPNRKTLMKEFGLMWRMFFYHLFPNNFIGWSEGDDDF